MNNDISLAKRRLPLPALMHRLELGADAKKSARCPFHDDQRNSFSVWENAAGLWFWKCHAGCGEGDEISFLEKQHGISRGAAIKLYLEMAGVNGAKPPASQPAEVRSTSALDWPACVAAFTDKHVERLAKWRGYSIGFCYWLRKNRFVGLYDGCIAFPVHDKIGNVVAVHYRLKDGSWRYYPRGAKVRPFVIGELSAVDPVQVFESQWDALVFMDKSGERSGIIITRGASNDALVLELIPECSTVYLWTQNDSAGEKWQKDICADTKAAVKRVRIAAPHKDLNEWTKAGATSDDLFRAVTNAKVIGDATGTPVRIAKLARPPEPLTFDQWRAVIEANFPALVRPAEICLSVVAQLLLNDVSNPFALALVDVPASGKTVTLNFFDGATELTYTTDNFTPAAFVSHASNVKREELSKVDLLPRIRYRTLIVRELGSVFGAKDDDLIKSLGILTRVLDGEGLETDSGVHGKRGYKGDYLFMLLAGTPPIPPRVFKIMGNFGSRLFFLSLHWPDESEDELIEENRSTSRKLKEAACKTATDNFLRTLWAANATGVDWNKSRDPADCLRVIARCARLLAALRGAINVWHSDEAGEKLSHNVPVIEKAHRINCLLYNLARAHALVRDRRQLSAHDLAPVLDVTFDSAPAIRAKLFRCLIDAGGVLTTSDVVKLLRCSPPTARKEMEALSVLGIVDKTAEDQDDGGRPEEQITLGERFAWFAGDGCKVLRGGATETQGGNLFEIQNG